MLWNLRCSKVLFGGRPHPQSKQTNKFGAGCILSISKETICRPNFAKSKGVASTVSTSITISCWGEGGLVIVIGNLVDVSLTFSSLLCFAMCFAKKADDLCLTKQSGKKQASTSFGSLLVKVPNSVSVSKINL